MDMVQLARMSMPVFLAATMFGISSSAEAENPPVQECDRLAASAWDTQAVAPAVLSTQIDAAKAIAVCTAAVRKFPDVARFQAQLGRAYEADKRDNKAAEWYKKAAAQGYAFAITSLGVYQKMGRGGAPKDDTAAADSFRAAAEKGSPQAMFSLAHMYETGEGVPKNDIEATKWYRAALDGIRRIAEQGEPAAQIELGLMYGMASGVAQDKKEAAKWLQKGIQSQSESQAKRPVDDFQRRVGVTEWIDTETLFANPFIYEEKIVGAVAYFDQMIDRNSAFFEVQGKNGKYDNPVIVSNLPTNLFRKKETYVVLAARVIGMGYANKNLPHLQYVDTLLCSEDGCGDVLRQKQ